MSDSKRIALTLGGIAILLAALGTGLVSSVIGAYDRAIDAAAVRETVTLPVAARTLYAGVPITAEDLMLVEMDLAWLPAGTTERVVTTPEALIGRVPKTRVLVNELIANERLSDFSTGDGINALIEPGKRALSIPLKDAAALQGLLEPGSYVDVLVTIAPEDDPSDVDTLLVTPNAYVLAVNGRSRHEESADERRRKRRSRPTVTLLLEPEVTEQVVHASHTGALTLTMINPTDPDRGLVFTDPIYIDPEQITAPGDLVPPVYVPSPEPLAEPDPFFLQVCKGRDCTMEEVEVGEE